MNNQVHGYLGSIGEFVILYNNKSAVNAMMDAIGGDTMEVNNYYLSSTLALYNNNGKMQSSAWWFQYNYQGHISNIRRYDTNKGVLRAFFKY